MLQPQIVHSPARLGLTNPNSPSLQNPTPPKFPSSSHQFHHHSTATSASTTATPNPAPTTSTTTCNSSTLLSLLPPLPRAQALLLQMASLASKLFDVSPNRSLWISAFRGSLPTFLSSQIQSQPPPPLESSPSTTKEIISSFTALQTQLFEAVAELQEILDLQDAKQKIAREVKSKDSSILAFANKIKEAERVLDILVDDYSDYRRPKRVKLEDGEDESDDSCTTTVASRLNLSDILSYAHRISYTTFAPPEFGAGGPLRGAMPPAPQEEQMRASQLYAFADLDVGLPKTVETKEKTIEAIIEPPPSQPADVNPLANLAGLLPSNFTVPSGWKPGMPVELPKDFPLMPPPGWKPGDAVPLPPLDAISVPRIDEQPMRPIPPQGLHKQPETIQVRHVELDILDQDDDSSDYSSEEGSSDDDN
ncbi:mediator of RNA polymerase II transcription subunit 4 [Pistacia vera]|uniref:mediator of RNA polymerase II transcription subunit 4 n=1 Tax=Pistacia vera TaxID=55513 RepID=UPI0012634B97|nr:mediator of RNA polymerase II transcription subunit 4 [Pistacia vera]